jgi:hypothetical protein
MTTYRFLSPEWIEAVGRLKHGREGSGLDAAGMVVNATITGVPFGSDAMKVHSLRGPVLGWEPGHADGAELAFVVDYFTAKALVIDPSPDFHALSQAIATGALVVEGDRDRLASWWRSARIGHADAALLEDEVRAITA